MCAPSVEGRNCAATSLALAAREAFAWCAGGSHRYTKCCIFNFVGHEKSHPKHDSGRSDCLGVQAITDVAFSTLLDMRRVILSMTAVDQIALGFKLSLMK
jgi:hypothetical protein